MKRTMVVNLAILALMVPAAAHATPTDEAEMSQTIWVAWQMPGPYLGYASWPQTYLPNGIPECGEGGVQMDEYKYGTDDIREKVDALLATGVLNSPADDSRVATRDYYFLPLEPCETAPSEVLPDVVIPEVDIVIPEVVGVDIVIPEVVDPALSSQTAASGATPVLQEPAYTG